MSTPARQAAKPGHPVKMPGSEAAERGQWVTVRYAIDRWDRTLRLCLILTVMSGNASVIVMLVHALLRH